MPNLGKIMFAKVGGIIPTSKAQNIFLRFDLSKPDEVLYVRYNFARETIQRKLNMTSKKRCRGPNVQAQRPLPPIS
jgi:hypothetical protein